MTRTTERSSAASSAPATQILARPTASPGTSSPPSARCRTSIALKYLVHRMMCASFTTDWKNFGNYGRENHPNGCADHGLPLAQRHAQPVWTERGDPVRERPASRARVLPAARQPEHGVLPQPARTPRLPGGEGLLRAGRARPVLLRVHHEPERPRVFQEVPLPELPRRVQVLHLVHAQDV